jgi:pyrroline-5-carboxylate reductase
VQTEPSWCVPVAGKVKDADSGTKCITIDDSVMKLWQFCGDDTISISHIVLICTKPDQTRAVCQNLVTAHDAVSARESVLPTVVAMCLGITIPTLESWLTLPDGTYVFGVVRTMPNTPVSLRQGATAVIASQRVTAVQLDRVVGLFRIVYPCVEVLSEESLLNVAMAISGYSNFPTLYTRMRIR